MRKSGRPAKACEKIGNWVRSVSWNSSISAAPNRPRMRCASAPSLPSATSTSDSFRSRSSKPSRCRRAFSASKARSTLVTKSSSSACFTSVDSNSMRVSGWRRNGADHLLHPVFEPPAIVDDQLCHVALLHRAPSRPVARGTRERLGLILDEGRSEGDVALERALREDALAEAMDRRDGEVVECAERPRDDLPPLGAVRVAQHEEIFSRRFRCRRRIAPDLLRQPQCRANAGHQFLRRLLGEGHHEDAREALHLALEQEAQQETGDGEGLPRPSARLNQRHARIKRHGQCVEAGARCAVVVAASKVALIPLLLPPSATRQKSVVASRSNSPQRSAIGSTPRKQSAT